jgi:hypothetical protein
MRTIPVTLRLASVVAMAGLTCVAACSSSGTGSGQASPSAPSSTGQSSASPSASPGHTGAEALAGALNSPPGTAPKVTFKATGLFTATGVVTLKRCGLSNHYRCIADPDLAFGASVLHVRYGKSSFTELQVGSNCNGSYANQMPYTITGGTGPYAGASGHGIAEIEFTGTFSKVNGACDFAGSAKPVKGSARLAYGASGPVTLATASPGA